MLGALGRNTFGMKAQEPRGEMPPRAEAVPAVGISSGATGSVGPRPDLSFPHSLA